MSAERPIIFSPEMVRALLAGTKSQTRRAVVPQPMGFWDAPNAHPETGLNAVVKDPITDSARDRWIPCPYGVPGDSLWVRESWALRGVNGALIYKADREGDLSVKWRSPIHLKRTDARLVLRIERLRCERLQEISEADALAEGVATGAHRGGLKYAGGATWVSIGHPGYGPAMPACARAEYACLWDQLNGARGVAWYTNPYVWVIEFTRRSPA